MLLSSNLIQITKQAQINRKLQQILFNITLKCSNQSNQTFLQYEKDPGPHFFDQETQNLLKSMTKLNIDTVFRRRSVPNNYVEYKFMTTEQIKKEVEAAFKRAERWLQMPPVVQIQVPEHKVISNDTALKNFSDTPFVFTDISYGLKDAERKIVIRQVDGTLENAPQDVRKRINQIYFPLPGRKYRTPKIFEPENLKKCLDEFKYEFILDLMCVQFEPYEQQWHDICCKVFLHINENKRFNDLRSTRHFGPMAFFYAWHRIIDDLLLDMIKRDYLQNALELIVLQCKLNNIEFQGKDTLTEVRNIPTKEAAQHFPVPSSGTVQTEIESTVGKTAHDFKADDLCLAVIKDFIKLHAVKKTQLELALQTYIEVNEEKKRIYEGLNKAHGIN